MVVINISVQISSRDYVWRRVIHRATYSSDA